MGIISNLLPTVSAQVANTATQAASVRADSASVQNQAVQTAVTSGQAAVVTLSSSSPKRVASYGESRSVDAAFEKQEAKGKVEKKAAEEKSSAGGAFKATA